jgi:spore coat protein CotF
VTSALDQTELLIYISKTKNSHLPNDQGAIVQNLITKVHSHAQSCTVKCTVPAESDHKCTVAQSNAQSMHSQCTVMHSKCTVPAESDHKCTVAQSNAQSLLNQ